MRLILLSALLSLFAVQVHAQAELGFAVGTRSGQAETDILNANVAPRAGFQVGPTAAFFFHDVWAVRSGLLYTQRFSRIERLATGEVDINFSYIDIPATLLLQAADFAGIFAGPIISFNQSAEISSNPNRVALDVKSFILPWVLGVNFRIFSQMGGEFYFEYVPGEFSTSVSEMKTVGANLLFYFE